MYFAYSHSTNMVTRTIFPIEETKGRGLTIVEIIHQDAQDTIIFRI